MAVHLEATLEAQEPRSRRRTVAPKLDELRSELERAVVELERARTIAAFNGGLAMRQNIPDSESAAGLMNLLVMEHAKAREEAGR